MCFLLNLLPIGFPLQSSVPFDKTLVTIGTNPLTTTRLCHNTKTSTCAKILNHAKKETSLKQTQILKP